MYTLFKNLEIYSKNFSVFLDIGAMYVYPYYGYFTAFKAEIIMFALIKLAIFYTFGR